MLSLSMHTCMHSSNVSISQQVSYTPQSYIAVGMRMCSAILRALFHCAICCVMSICIGICVTYLFQSIDSYACWCCGFLCVHRASS